MKRPITLMTLVACLFALTGNQASQAAAALPATDRPLNVLIMVDMEGLHGIADRELLYDSRAWEVYGRDLLTSEINAAATGIMRQAMREHRDARIVVSSAHNLGHNINELALLPIVQTLPAHAATSTAMYGTAALAELYQSRHFDAAMLLGYYAKAGTKGCFAHSLDGDRIRDIQINSRSVGEIELLSTLCGEFGTPVILVSGDRAATTEATQTSPKVRTVITKEMLPNKWIALRPASEVLQELSDQAALALSERAQFPMLKASSPVTMTLQLADSQTPDAALVPEPVMRQGNRFSWQRANFLAAYSALWRTYLSLFVQ